MPVGTGSDPDDAVPEKRGINEDPLDTRQRKRRHRAGLEIRRVPYLLGPRDPGRRAARSPRDLLRIGPAVARDEREDRPAVAVEDERLDDLPEVAADSTGRCLGRRRAVGKLLDLDLCPGFLEVRGHALDRLRPRSRRHVTRVASETRRAARAFSFLVKRTRERIAKTESLFRNVNEGIKEASDRLETDAARFVCECGDPNCADRLDVPLDEYESVREHATRFVVSPGHVKGPVETVVKRTRGYSVIEKVDRVVKRIVKRLNPRAENA